MASIPPSLGIGSGLDLGSLLQGLKDSEQGRLVPLERREASYEAKLSAYGLIQSALEKLQTSAEGLGKTELFEGVSVTSKNEAFAATASPEASGGSYSINVDTLARAQSLVSAGQTSMTDPIGDGGTITLSLGDGAGNVSSSVDISLSSEDSTLTGVRDAINASGSGVSASIINDGTDTPYRLVLSSKATGTDSQISVDVQNNAALSGLMGYQYSAAGGGSGGLEETVAAANAQISVNGIPITSQSNTVEDAIQGVTLTLSSVTTEPETLSTKSDTGSIKDEFKSLVSAYNRMQSISSELTAFNGPDSDSGILLGDSTARAVQSRIRSALNTPVEEGKYFSMAQIGISLQRDGTMKIDEAKLDKALSTDLAGVSALLTGSETAPGVSTILTDTLKGLTGDNGMLQIASNGTQRSIENIGERMVSMQASIDSTIARYKAQFTELDSIMSSLNSTQSYLTQQFESLNNQNR